MGDLAIHCFVRFPANEPAVQPVLTIAMLVPTVPGVPLGTPMLRVATADGPEVAVAVAVNGVPAKKLEKGKVLVQPVPAMVMVPDSANRPSAFADAA